MKTLRRVILTVLSVVSVIALIFSLLLAIANFSARRSSTGTPTLFGYTFAPFGSDVLVMKVLDESETGSLSAGNTVLILSDGVSQAGGMQYSTEVCSILSVSAEREGQALLYNAQTNAGKEIRVPAQFIIADATGTQLRYAAPILRFGMMGVFLLLIPSATIAVVAIYSLASKRYYRV